MYVYDTCDKRVTLQGYQVLSIVELPLTCLRKTWVEESLEGKIQNLGIGYVKFEMLMLSGDVK